MTGSLSIVNKKEKKMVELPILGYQNHISLHSHGKHFYQSFLSALVGEEGLKYNKIYIIDIVMSA